MLQMVRIEKCYLIDIAKFLTPTFADKTISMIFSSVSLVVDLNKGNELDIDNPVLELHLKVLFLLNLKEYLNIKKSKMMK